MIVFRAHCQLGNQMFIYSCAHSLAKFKKRWYCLSNIKDLKYFELNKYDRVFNSLKYFLFRVESKIFQYKFYHFQDNRKCYSMK